VHCCATYFAFITGLLCFPTLLTLLSYSTYFACFTYFFCCCNNRGLRIIPAASGSAEAAARLPYRVPSEATPFSYNITLMVSLYMRASSRVSARTNVLGREVTLCNYNIMVSFYVCGSSRVSAHTRAPRRCRGAHTHTHTRTPDTYIHSDFHEFV
jgi:hypothetical protein